MTGRDEEQRVREAIRGHVRTSAFAEAEKVISALLSDPGVQEARAQVEAAETQLGTELRAHLQPFQDRYDQAVRDGDAAVLTGICAGRIPRVLRCPGPAASLPRAYTHWGAMPWL
ncbi:hypothetical protein [Streptomyces odonnellii]|uniref:hypothetical protein n=1 Tax=Streptomyces odonnellii TaxID=1417980 RepID=UPI0018E37433|nr:hypothetical protein [Streptomyces odonnellii]